MTSNTRNGDTSANNGRASDRARQAIAADMRARGGNPVTVSDVRQRHSMPAGKGRAFLSTLLRRP